MKRKDIVINYIKTWFLIDLIASFPYNWFPISDSGDAILTTTSNQDTFVFDPITGYYNSTA